MCCEENGRKARNLGQRSLLDTLKSYHLSNYLSLIMPCIGSSEFPYLFKIWLQRGQCNECLHEWSIILFCFWNHRGWLLLYNSNDNIICSTVSNHLSPLVSCPQSHRRQGETGYKKGLGGEDMGRRRKERKGEGREMGESVEEALSSYCFFLKGMFLSTYYVYHT